MSSRDNLMDQMDQIFSKIGRNLRHKMSDDSLTFAQFAVMRTLFQEGPLVMSALAEQLGISLAGATGIVDRLVNAGMIERQRSDSDRRVVRVDLSDEGRRRMAQMKTERHEFLVSLVSPLTDDDLTTLVTLLRRVADHIGH